MSVEKRLNVLSHFKGLVEKDTLEAAYMIAAFLHAGVKDNGGVAYIQHPVWISQSIALEGGSVEEQIVGLLHDTVEDTALTLNELREWFNNRIVDAVDALSKRENENIDEYVHRVLVNKIARYVKKKDLTHNMDIKRLKNRRNLRDKDLERIRIYANMYDMIVGGEVGV